MFAAMLLVLNSCTSDRERLLESVPMDAEYVVTLDAVRLADQSGITVENGQLVLPSELSVIKDNIPAEALSTMGKIAEAIDLRNIVVFGYANKGTAYLTAKPRDLEQLRSILEENKIESTTEGWRETWALGSEALVIDTENNQIWVIEKRDLDRIDEFRRGSSDNSILRYSGIADVLTADNIANMAADLSTLDAGLGNNWLTGSSNIKDNAIVAEMTAMTPDGKTLDSDFLKPVDIDFLRYMPANFIGAMAIGINPESEWVSQMQKGIEKTNDRQARVMFGEAMPYLKALDGTVAIGFGPKNKASLLDPESPQQWQTLLMAHMRQNKVNELTELLRSLLPGSTEAGKGLYRFSSQDFSLVYGTVDGYFAAATGMDLKPDKSNAFTEVFDGKPFAMVLQTPLLSSIVDDPSLAYSIKATMQTNGPTLNFRLDLVGTDSKIVTTLFNDLPRFTTLYFTKTAQASQNR